MQKSTRSIRVHPFVLAILACQLSAQPVAFYDADIDGAGSKVSSEFPTVSPFNWKQTTSGGTVVRQSSEVIDGDSTNYFRINASTMGDLAGRFYSVNLSPENPAFTDPRGWTFTSVVRVPFAEGNINTSAYMRVDDGSRSHIVSFINEPGFEGLGYGETILASAPILLQAADISSDYVTVQMWYDPDRSETTVYLNGSVQESFASSDAPPSSSYQASWGRATWSGNGSDVYWNYVALEAGKTVAVPEVSSLR